MRLFCVIICFYITVALCFSQSVSGLRIYSELSPSSRFIFSEPNELGFQFLASKNFVFFNEVIEKGLLVQVNGSGDVIKIDSLRNNDYDFAYRIDDLLLLSSYNFNKYPDTVSTFVLEICNLNGGVIKSFEHDFRINVPFGSGVAPVNDSIVILAQGCVYTNSEPGIVFYEINVRSLEVSKRLAFKGGIIGEIQRISDVPEFLEWSFALWRKDTSFVHNNSLSSDTVNASQLGTILPRKDGEGWFGFGGCTSPSNFYGICMIAFDADLNYDKVDLIYHPPSGNATYTAATSRSICRNNDFYYAAGIWNFVSNYSNIFIDTFTSEIVVVKYDLELNRVWSKVIGGDRRYRPQVVQPTEFGGFLVAGVLRDNLNGHIISPFAMFFDADGELVGTEEEAPPGRYEFTIYGNPGREALRIMSRFEGGQAQLLVVDMMGRPVLQRTLTEGMNEYETAFWPAGTYLMTITDQQGRILWNQPWIKVE
jgi:hypothetical protein